MTVWAEASGPVGWIWLDRPERSNAMNRAFFSDFAEAVHRLNGLPDIRAVVLASTSRNFCTGLDLAEAGDLIDSADDEAAIDTSIAQLQDSIRSLATLQYPVIAAITGYCIGGGLDLAACSDIRICSNDTIFSLREIRLGMVADLGSLQRLPAVIPRGTLSEWAFTGRDFDAQSALSAGLVNRVHSDREDTLASARNLAKEIAQNPPGAVAGTKNCLSLFFDHAANIDDLYRIARNLNVRQLKSKEAQRAITNHFTQGPTEKETT